MTRIYFAAMLLVLACCVRAQDIPLVFSSERTCPSVDVRILPPDSLPSVPGLPDPFAWADGSGRSTDYADWERHRAEIIAMLEGYEIGHKPEVPRDSVEAWMDADTLRVRVHNGNTLDLSARIVYPEGDGPFPAIIGVGWPTGSLPQEIFSRRGIAAIAFDFNQVMSHTQVRGTEPINSLYPDLTEMGAYCAWPWGISRIIDGLEIVGDSARIDTSHLGVTGCSFAGKMALFAGALDERIALTIAQEPGGGGAAAWRVSETLGEVETLGRTNYSWFMESMRRFADCVDRRPSTITSSWPWWLPVRSWCWETPTIHGSPTNQATCRAGPHGWYGKHWVSLTAWATVSKVNTHIVCFRRANVLRWKPLWIASCLAVMPIQTSYAPPCSTTLIG